MSYAGTKKEVFDPERLFMDKNGLLLHEIVSHEHLKVGSFDTNLACELSENLKETEDGVHIFEWNGTEYPLIERSLILDHE